MLLKYARYDDIILKITWVILLGYYTCSKKHMHLIFVEMYLSGFYAIIIIKAYHFYVRTS